MTRHAIGIALWFALGALAAPGCSDAAPGDANPLTEPDREVGTSHQELQTPATVIVPRSRMCVTRGAASVLPGSWMEVTDPTFRGFVLGPPSSTASLRAVYLGPTAVLVPLASGDYRTQIGLKLRAADGCNLVYVMWRIAPQPKLVVSVKRNPGMHTSTDCGVKGYVDIVPNSTAPIPNWAVGQTHVLSATITGSKLKAYADDKEVWSGDLGAAVLGFDGPVGLRSDDARFRFQLSTPLGSQIPPCTSDGGD